MMKPLDDLTNLELPIDGKIIKLVFKSKATEELIADIEKIFDEVIFIKNGEIILHENSEKMKNVDHGRFAW